MNEDAEPLSDTGQDFEIVPQLIGAAVRVRSGYEGGVYGRVSTAFRSNSGLFRDNIIMIVTAITDGRTLGAFTLADVVLVPEEEVHVWLLAGGSS